MLSRQALEEGHGVYAEDGVRFNKYILLHFSGLVSHRQHSTSEENAYPVVDGNAH